MLRRRMPTMFLAIAIMLFAAPAALARDHGEGWYGETNDKAVTNAGFILIIAFPLIVFAISMLQGHLERRKDARKRADKARAASERWRNGW